MSAIKSVLKDDGYEWQQNNALISAITRACQLENDMVKCCFLIQIGLLETILFEVKRKFGENQPYLETMYLALFAIAYYGLMRIREVVNGTHTVKAKDIHIGENKNKMCLVLYHSKTHGKTSFHKR